MSFALKVSGYNRRRKWQLFQDVVRPTPETTVLDVGYTDIEYTANDNYIEKHFPWRAHITALGTEEPVQFQKHYPDVPVVHYDGTTFPFEDKTFDVCWSNAVIEHVGRQENRWAAQVFFVKEIARVARTAFFTTPNKHFPVEVHTRTPLLHWLPKPIFDRYLRLTKRAWATGDYMDLLSMGDMRRILREAGIGRYRIIQNKLFGMTLDFVVVFGEGLAGEPAGNSADQPDAG
jgi:hypothetical protein